MIVYLLDFPLQISIIIRDLVAQEGCTGDSGRVGTGSQTVTDEPAILTANIRALGTDGAVAGCQGGCRVCSSEEGRE